MLVEGLAILELQREIDGLRVKTGHLEEMDNVHILANNRLDELHEKVQNYIVLFAQHLGVEMNAAWTSKMKEIEDNYIEIY